MGGGVFYHTISTPIYPWLVVVALERRGVIMGKLVNFGFPPPSFSSFFLSPFRGESIAVGPRL
jgi:hypothetical protein